MNGDWASGYSTDVPYTLGFYKEMAPAWLHHACVASGHEGLRWDAGLRYCEPGCGRGYGTALLAAANPDIEFVGIDFNPAHIAEANSFAATLDLPNLSYREASFAEAIADDALGAFDMMAFHGVYTWVTPPIRAEVRELARTRLAPGGVLYLSYNTMPGWSVVAPMQRLVMEMAARSAGDSVARFGHARTLLDTLSQHGSGFTAQNPAVNDRIARMGEQDAHYLAHEYLNEGWEPRYVADVMAEMAEAKLTYVGSANVAENRTELCVPPGLRETVAGAQDRAMAEMLKDFVLNKQFRRDVYVKGPLPLSPSERAARLAALAFARIHMGKDFPASLRTPVGATDKLSGVVETVMARLDEGPATLADLARALAPLGVQPGSLPVLMDVLLHNSLVAPARPDHASVDPAPAQALNARVLALAQQGDSHRYLASPVLGSALGINRFEQMVAASILEVEALGRGPAITAALQSFARAGLSLAPAEDGKGDDRDRMGGLVDALVELGLPRWRRLKMVGAP